MFSASPCTNGYHDVTDEVAEPEDPTPEVPDPGETTAPEEPGPRRDYRPRGAGHRKQQWDQAEQVIEKAIQTAPTIPNLLGT